MRAGKPWKRAFCWASEIQRVRVGLEGNRRQMAWSVAAMSDGSPESATQRNGPRPSQKSGRMYSGAKPGNWKASGTPRAVGGEAADIVAVIEGPRARALQVEHGAHVGGDGIERPVEVGFRVARAMLD